MFQSNNSFLSKPGNAVNLSPNKWSGDKPKSFYESPMVPIKENDSEKGSTFSFKLIKSLLPVEKERLKTHIEISSFGDCAFGKSPGIISNFSTSKCTGELKASTDGKYKYELDDESETSSEECLSYEEGCSDNAYSDIYIENMSKQSLANLRRKSAYLTKAPMKPLNNSQFDKNEDSENSDEDEYCSPLFLKVTKCKSKKRRQTLKVQAIDSKSFNSQTLNVQPFK